MFPVFHFRLRYSRLFSCFSSRVNRVHNRVFNAANPKFLSSSILLIWHTATETSAVNILNVHNANNDGQSICRSAFCITLYQFIYELRYPPADVVCKPVQAELSWNNYYFRVSVFVATYELRVVCCCYRWFNRWFKAFGGGFPAFSELRTGMLAHRPVVPFQLTILDSLI